MRAILYIAGVVLIALGLLFSFTSGFSIAKVAARIENDELTASEGKGLLFGVALPWVLAFLGILVLAAA